MFEYHEYYYCRFLSFFKQQRCKAKHPTETFHREEVSKLDRSIRWKAADTKELSGAFVAIVSVVSSEGHTLNPREPIASIVITRQTSRLTSHRALENASSRWSPPAIPWQNRTYRRLLHPVCTFTSNWTIGIGCEQSARIFLLDSTPRESAWNTRFRRTGEKCSRVISQNRGNS